MIKKKKTSTCSIYVQHDQCQNMSNVEGMYCTYTTYTGRQKRMNSTQYRNTMKHVKPKTVTIIVEIGWSPRCSNRMFRMQLQQRANDTLKSNGSSSFSPPYDKGAPQYTKKASLIQVYQLYSHLFIPFYLFSFLKKNGFYLLWRNILVLEIIWVSPVFLVASSNGDLCPNRLAAPSLAALCAAWSAAWAILSQHRRPDGYPIRSSFSAQPWLMVPNMWYHPLLNIGFYV